MELNTPSSVANSANTSKSVPSISTSSIGSEDADADWNPQEAGSNTGKESSKKRKRNFKRAPGTYHRTAKLTPSADDPDINALFKTTVSEIDGQRIFTCLKCSNEFSTPYNARRHSNVHLKQSRTECEVCGQTLSGPLSLAAHREKHKNQGKGKMRLSKSNKRKSKSSEVPVKDTAAESLVAPDIDVPKRDQPEKSSKKKPQKRANEGGTEVRKEAEDAIAAPSKKSNKKAKEEATEVEKKVEDAVAVPSKKRHKKKPSADVAQTAESVPDPAPALAPDEISSNDVPESAAALDSMPGVVTRTSKFERSSSKKSQKKADEDEAEVAKEAEDSVAAPSKKSNKKAKDDAAEVEKKVEDAVTVPSKKRHKKKPSADVAQAVDAVDAPASDPIPNEIPINDAPESVTAPDCQPVTRPSKSVRSSSKKSNKKATNEDETEVEKEAEDAAAAAPSKKDLKRSKEETETEVSEQVETTVTAPSKKCVKKKASADGAKAAESVPDPAPALAPDEVPANDAPESAAALDTIPGVVTRTSKSERNSSKKWQKKTDEDEAEVAKEAEDAVAVPSKFQEIMAEVTEGAESKKTRKKKTSADQVVESAEDTVAATVPEEMPSSDTTESAIAPVSQPATPGDSDGSLSEGVNEVVRGVQESVSLEDEEIASISSSQEALLGSTPGSLSVSSMSEMSEIESVIEHVAVPVRKVKEDAVVATAIIPTEIPGDAMDAVVVEKEKPSKEEEEMPILMRLMQEDAPEIAVAAEQVESKGMESDGGKESQDEQMSSDVLEVMQRVVDAVSFIAAADDEHPFMEGAFDESVFTLEPEPVIPTAAATPATASAKKKKRNRMVGYQLIEVAEEPDKDGVAVTGYATRTREEEEQSGSRPSTSQERRSSRIQMRMAMEASAVEEARMCTRTRKVTPPPIYPSNIEKVREAREMEREMKESREMARRALAQLPEASKRPRASTHADGTGVASKRSKRSSRAGSSSRASSSRESLFVTRRDAAAAAGLLKPRRDGSTAAAAAAAPSRSTYYDPRSSLRAPSSMSLLVSSSSPSSSRRATPQPPPMTFQSLSPRGPFVGSRPQSLCNNSLYPRLGALCGPRVHRHQPMLSAPASLHFPAQLTAVFLSTIFHPAWMRPTEIGDDEKAAISRRGAAGAHLMLPVRMFRTETLIERCLQALEETSIPLPPLQPLLPAPCPLLADGCSDPLSDVLKFVPRVPTGPVSFSSHRVQSIAEARYTMASEGARNHVYSKSEDRKWWEVRTFPSFDALSFHGHRPPLPTSARRHPHDGLWYTVADKNKTGIQGLRLATKCTYVTSKKPVFSVHESMPLLRAAPPAPYRTPSVYSTPAPYSTHSVYSTPAASSYVAAAPPSVVNTSSASYYGAEQNQTSRPPAFMRPQPPAGPAPSSSSSSVMTMTTAMPRPVDVPSSSSSSPTSSSTSDRQAQKRAADCQVASMVKRIKSSFHESSPGRPTERQPQSQPLQQQQPSVQQPQPLPPLQLQPRQSQQYVQQPPMYRPEHAYFYEYESEFNSSYQVAPARPEVITVEEDGTTFAVL